MGSRSASPGGNARGEARIAPLVAKAAMGDGDQETLSVRISPDDNLDQGVLGVLKRAEVAQMLSPYQALLAALQASEKQQASEALKLKPPGSEWGTAQDVMLKCSRLIRQGFRKASAAEWTFLVACDA